MTNTNSIEDIRDALKEIDMEMRNMRETIYDYRRFLQKINARIVDGDLEDEILDHLAECCYRAPEE